MGQSAFGSLRQSALVLGRLFNRRINLEAGRVGESSYLFDPDTSRLA